jgi:CheY-like chemotaxis protein
MKKTVMIVDDDKDIRDTVKEALSREGYSVVTATSGDDCLKKLQKKDADLILLDIMMPGKTVRQVVPKIKRSKIAYLTIVKASDAEKEQLLKQKNVVEFIEKPFDIDGLIKNVKKILK